jgi:hypothetical protein
VDGSTSIFGVAGSGSTVPLVVSAGSGPADCTLGAGPDKHCIGNTNTGMACTADANCGGGAGACALDANCLFAPPLPIENSSLSTCVVNVIQTDAGGSGDFTAQSSSVTPSGAACLRRHRPCRARSVRRRRAAHPAIQRPHG